jgi:hypothetical protein
MDPDPAIFVIDLQDASKKLIIYHNFFCLILFEITRTFATFSKIKSQKESQNTRNHDDRRIRIREAQKHVDPVDPDLDLQH